MTISTIFKKHLPWFAIVLLSLSYTSLSLAQNTRSPQAAFKPIKQLGTSQAICKKPGVQSADALRAFFAENPELIKKIMRDAGLEEVTDALMRDIQAGKFIEKRIAVDTEFEWMAMRKKSNNGQRQVVADPNRIWQGKDAFDAFYITVQHDCNSYELVIPKICCNLALMSANVVSEAPKIDLSVDGDRLTVCGDSQHQWALSKPNGVTQAFTLNDNGCQTFEDLAPGDVLVIATAQCGQSHERATIGQQIAATENTVNEVQSKSKLVPYVSVLLGSETVMRFEDAWQMYKRDASGFVSLRAGLKIPVQLSGFYIVPQIGILYRNGINEGIDYPDTNIHVDIGFEKQFQKLFIGTGYGLWNADDSEFRENSIYLQAGININKKFQWFVEARGFSSDSPEGTDSVSDNHAYSAGLRISF